jgi:tRNA dimethylallyltransferase
MYAGMDIGTAKLTPTERRGVPHHLLDVWPVTEPASVAAYQVLARRTVDDLLARDRVPVVVGGSGLYVRAVLEDLRFPGTDAAVRSRLEGELAEYGAAALHARLAELDPVAAGGILPSNGRRIVRALEVVELAGRFIPELPEHRYVHDTVQIGLAVPRVELDEHITRRVDRMWERGLVEEVRRLETCGLRKGRTASRALGYAQVLHLLTGEWTADRARAETVRATRRFARRQESWFRRDPRVRWVPYDGKDLLAAVATLTGSRL